VKVVQQQWKVLVGGDSGLVILVLSTWVVMVVGGKGLFDCSQ
jgi:hypothetical protein